MKSKVTSIFIIFLFLTSCGLKKKGASRTKSEGSLIQKKRISSLNPASNSEDVRENLIKDGYSISYDIGIQLLGTWKSSCDSSEHTSNKIVLIFSNDKIINTTEYFSELNCKQLLFTESNVLSFKLDEIYTNNRNILFFSVQESAIGTIHQKEFITRINEQKWFGFSDWELEKSKNVSGKSISPDIEPNSKNGTEVVMRFQLNVNKIILGDETNSIILNKN